MAYVPVPKDLTRVKTKVALNLTKRQLIFFGLAIVTGIPFYIFTKDLIGPDIAAILMVTIMLPSFFMAMYEKDGLPFEKVMGNILRQNFMSPQVRPYRTENFYKEIDTMVRKEGVPNGKKKKRAVSTTLYRGKEKGKRKKKRGKEEKKAG